MRSLLMRSFPVLVSILLIAASCAPIPTLNVTYHLPQSSQGLQGKEVVLTVQDHRKSDDLIGKGAKEDFEHFSGYISFSLARMEEPGFKMGTYDVPSLFRESFKRRLENAGARVLVSGPDSRPELVIAIQEFLLDLKDRKWIARMAYEARLVKNNEISAKQAISGQAERLKVVGRSQADRLMEDIFTDMVNRLDVGRLFEQAGL